VRRGRNRVALIPKRRITRGVYTLLIEVTDRQDNSQWYRYKARVR
jgi:hypothetical protein